MGERPLWRGERWVASARFGPLYSRLPPTSLLEYEAEEHGILVDRVSEENTSRTCSCCGQIRDANRVERGLYVCESCESTMNADVNGAVNIRRKIT